MDRAQAIAVDVEENVYVTGYAAADLGWDYTTIKYNSGSSQLWLSSYNGPAGLNDMASDIAVDALGYSYVTGYSVGILTGFDYATLKYDPDGLPVWTTRYDPGQKDDDYAVAVMVDDFSNVYVTGYSFTDDASNYDYVTIKYSPEGTTLWTAIYNGPASNLDYALALALDSEGCVYVTGMSQGMETDFDYATIKYNPLSGNMLWEARHDGPVSGSDEAYDVGIGGDDYVYVTGGSEGDGTSQDYATIKYDPLTGDSLWVARYNAQENGADAAKALAVDGDNHICVTGMSWGGNVIANFDYATLMYDSDGNEMWTSRYDGSANSWDEARAIAVDGEGNFIVSGGSTEIGTASDYTTITYIVDGQETWRMNYNGAANGADVANDIAVGPSGAVFVIGYSQGIETGDDYLTVKYSPIPPLQVFRHAEAVPYIP